MGASSMTRKAEILRLFSLADRKGFDVARSTIRDRWRLVDSEGKTARKHGTNLAAFTARDAILFLEAMPDRIGRTPGF